MNGTKEHLQALGSLIIHTVKFSKLDVEKLELSQISPKHSSEDNKIMQYF